MFQFLFLFFFFFLYWVKLAWQLLCRWCAKRQWERKGWRLEKGGRVERDFNGGRLMVGIKSKIFGNVWIKKKIWGLKPKL